METQKNEIVKIDPKEFGLETASAEKITKGLTNILKERDVLSGQYAKVIKLEITSETIGTFRKLRLQVRDNRTKGIEAWHKVNKEFFLRGGQFVDAIKRKECEENIRMEEQLLKGEKHFELIEEEKKAKLKEERETALAKYEVETEHIQLSEMSDEVWENYFNGVKSGYEKVKAAEKKAEAERIAKEKAEKAEQERIRKENERLQKETEAKEKQIQTERAKAEKERKIIEEKNRKEREVLEAKTRKETEAKVKLEKELQARKDKEIQAEKVKQEAIENEARATDKQKLIELAGRFANPKLPEVKSREAKKILQEVAESCHKISIFILKI